MFQQKLGEQLFIQQGSLHPLTQDMMRMTLLPKSMSSQLLFKVEFTSFTKALLRVNPSLNQVCFIDSSMLISFFLQDHSFPS
jgi:hypothetical protein